MDDQNKPIPPGRTTGQPLGPTRAQKPKKKKRRIFLKIFLGLLFLGCIAFLAVSAVVYSYVKESPKLETSKLEGVLSSRILGPDGKLLFELYTQKRETVPINEVPPLLKQAIISIEDKRFEEHIGVDPIRIAGAAVANFTGSGGLQGGSTLTQQLIKLSFFSTDVKDQNYKRKIQEAWMSIQLERQKSKDEILNYYINKVYMSSGYYGMETAAKGYYNKPLSELSIAQTALMAGIPQAPADYDPILNPEAAKKRRDMVLNEMYKDEIITKAEYDAAVNEPISEGIVDQQPLYGDSKIIDNYIKEVIAEAQTKTTRDIYTDGLDIYTNIDMDLQRYIYHMVNSDEYVTFRDYTKEELFWEEGETPVDVNFQTAITVINPNNGQVLAQIGGRKVPDGVQFGNNMAVSAERDFGSTVKPITDYAPAIEYLNYGTGRYVVDEPYKYPGTSDSVNNYDRAYKGTMTIREALVDSRNVPAVKTLDEVTLEKSAEFLRGLGIDYGEGNMFLSNAIHGNLTSHKMAGAYSALANGGIYYKPYYVNKIVLPDGQEETFKPEGTRAMQESTAYMVTDTLKDVLLRGTGTQAIISDLYQAGKTGTSNYDDDSLAKLKLNVYGGVPDISFVGYTKNFVVSIWTGYENYFVPIASEDQQDAMTLYKFIMSHISQDVETTDWEMPENVVKIGNELYVKDHVNDQSIWKQPVSSWQEQDDTNYVPPASSSTIPPVKDSTPATSEPPIEPDPPTDPTVEPEPPTSTPPTDPPTTPTTPTTDPGAGAGGG
ncbi:PBP1A family penicillin-binding protein [Vagococcus sp. BWB3-3]|uniref:PBP1A family penicillin-binding protein n=1 Tax=Vagococcus allomyrinae TaxID=2794353 RepID=A0A940P952_9ENTE|nr:PBP1A family penicillin-binding protein [Vagococcus allomyrinae]MBP1043325.1 PBP1A family penicillin-binding protein [Vagococcus allomyrinae]